MLRNESVIGTLVAHGVCLLKGIRVFKQFAISKLRSAAQAKRYFDARDGTDKTGACFTISFCLSYKQRPCECAFNCWSTRTTTLWPMTAQQHKLLMLRRLVPALF